MERKYKTAESDCMTDSHIHIGQFNEIYYTAEEVFNVVFTIGAAYNIDRLVFSSTTSCIEGVPYGAVATEIEAALKLYGPEKTAPLFWLIPAYIEQGINIEQIMNDLPYHGFKLHPLIHNWDFENTDHVNALRKAFDYAEQKKMPVLIHTGEGAVHSPDRFQAFFELYPTVQFILAHSRPIETTITMLQSYSNVYCDSSFVLEENLKKIAAAGFASRMLFGTDFPITCYFRKKYPQQGNISVITLREQYKEDAIQSMYFM